jgi:hypothetical protein
MKKIIAIFAFLMLIMFGFQNAQAYQIKADAQTKRIPMGTKLNLEAASTVTTELLRKGDMFSAYLTQDVYVDDVVVLPKGTIVRGNTADVVRKKRLSKSAILYLNFDHIVAPNGKQLPIRAGISSHMKLTNDGGIGGGGYKEAFLENADKSGEIIAKSVDWGVNSGEELFKGGKFLITPFAALGGTVAGAGYLIGDSIADLFRKGQTIVITKGQRFTIMLLEPLDVPIY